MPMSPRTNQHARALGTQPENSKAGPMGIQNEVALHAPYREWLRLMRAGASGTPAF